MGCDIHINIEQQHPDGRWETVMHDMERWTKSSRPCIEFLDGLGMRSYVFFGLLSGVRQNEHGPWLAEDGLPEDASFFSRDRFERPGDDPELKMQIPVSGDMHSHGWILWKDLIDAAMDPSGLPETLMDRDCHEVLQHKVGLVEDALKAADPVMIFRGRYRHPDEDIYHPDMQDLSAHERLALAQRASELGPVTGFNVRLLFCYDN